MLERAKLWLTELKLRSLVSVLFGLSMGVLIAKINSSIHQQAWEQNALDRLLQEHHIQPSQLQPCGIKWPKVTVVGATCSVIPARVNGRRAVCIRKFQTDTDAVDYCVVR